MHVEYVKIKSIKRLEKKEDVYCLGTQHGNFIANGIIIKNCDALRYCIATHKVAVYNPYSHNPNEYLKDRFNASRSNF
jgi:hypothetical protein